jgi:hypothetical protein
LENSYLFRMTALFAIKDVSVVIGKEATQEHLLPIALSMVHTRT